MATLTSEKRISKARTNLLLQAPFWGFLILHVEPAPTVGLAFGTMATDGTKLYYDPDGQMKDWTDDQLMTAIAHETAHCAFSHLWRRENRDPMLWNMATDYFVNGMLAKESQVFKLHPSWLHDNKFDGMSSEAIYAKLIQECEKDGKGGGTLDDPEMWKNVTNGKRPGGSGSPNPTEDGKDGTPPKEGKSPENDAGDELYWKEKVVQAASVAKMAGKLPGHLAELIDNLVDPKLNWKEILREYIQKSVKNDYRRMPPSKKFLWMPLYLPSLKGEEVKVVACIDTSGSISTKEATTFLSELRGMMDQFSGYEIHYFQVDAQIQKYQVLTPENDEEWTCEINGRGGTSFIPVFEEVKNLELDPSVLVYFTDLEGPFPSEEPPYPVLWLATGDREVPFGEKILFEDI